MNLQEFQQASKRTMPFGGEPSNQQEFENMLGNYAMGLAGEWFELNLEISKCDMSIEKAKKEAGDVLHYAVGLLEILGYQANEMAVSHKVIPQDITKAMIVILESPKKHIYHRHELPKLQMIGAVNDVIAHIDNFFNLSEVCKMNINKLKTRYPEKFSTADSIARVDVVEGKG